MKKLVKVEYRQLNIDNNLKTNKSAKGNANDSSELFDYKKRIREIFKAPQPSPMKSSDASHDLLK